MLRRVILLDIIPESLKLPRVLLNRLNERVLVDAPTHVLKRVPDLIIIFVNAVTLL